MSDTAKRVKRRRAVEPQGEVAETAFCPRYADQTADVKLVSSDGVVFRVHSYHLKAASAPLRALIDDWAAEHGQTSIVNMYAKPQDHVTVEAFLDMCYGTAPCDIDDMTDQRLFDLIIFLSGHSCAPQLDSMRYRLRAALNNGTCALTIFAAGALMDDPETCRLAIAADGDRYWARPEHADIDSQDTQPLSENVYDKNTLNVLAMGDSWWDVIPIRYIRALGRANLKHKTGRKTDWQAAADEFYRQIRG